jgi:Domain of unknown function (DUF1851)
MEITECIRKAWGWTGIEPSEVIGDNAFGNLMVRDTLGYYWRLSPEDLSCQVIARNRSELNLISHDQTFLHDWHMTSLVEQAEKLLGPHAHGRKYCLRIPGPIGGEYGGDNLASLELHELVLASGYIAEQIKDLPEGATVQLKITD